MWSPRQHQETKQLTRHRKRITLEKFKRLLNDTVIGTHTYVQ